MCDSMGEFYAFGLFDYDRFDEDGWSTRPHRRSSYRYNYDPLCFSRKAAICERCGKRYENLHRSVAETAAEAQRDGWQIDHNGDGYEWYCPECKAIHDFADADNRTSQNTEPLLNLCKWECIGCNDWQCGYCGFIITVEDGERPSDKYCRDCGAKMYSDNYGENY